MLIRKLKKTMLCSLLTIVTTPLTTSSQDLIAGYVPVKWNVRPIDSIMIQKHEDEYRSAADRLYETWSNSLIHYSSAALLPEEFSIDLRNFSMPTDSRVVTSNYGPRWNRRHAGIDIKVYVGDTIRAAFNGKVRIAQYDKNGYGNFIVIRHPNGLETYYGHLSKQLVKENQTVHSGQPIGLGGNTGRSTGSHLHFETRLCGLVINPALLFDFENQDVTGDCYVYRKNGTKSVETSGDLRIYKVKRGETLTAIAKKTGTTVAELCKINNIKKSSRLATGQIIRYR